jgi:perosamine synthetase
MAALDPLHVVNQTLYCGGPFVRLRDWLGVPNSSADRIRSWPQFRERCVIGTYRGRSAIALACRLLGIGPGHEVLVPAYNCGTELDAVLYSGAHIVGYQVSRQCEIDLQDLIGRRSSRTRAVYLIHYFGWEQPMADLRRWCDDQDLLLIEDCALALFSKGCSGAIGRTGDAAIFSLPKTLGFYHGGLLSISASRAVAAPILAPAGFASLLKEIQLSARAKTLGSMERFGIFGALLSARRRFRGNRHLPNADGELPQMPDDYYFNAEIYADRAFHPRAFKVAGSLSCDEIVRCRRGNYSRLAGMLDRIHGLKPLFHELPEGVCPLSLPLVVSNRDAFVEALQARGIAAPPWWAGFHRNGIDWSQFPDARWLKQNVLTLPIHHRLEDRHLTFIAETVDQLIQSAGIGSGTHKAA